MIIRYKAFISLVLPVLLLHCSKEDIQKSGFVKGDLLYRCSMTTDSTVNGWRMEGPGVVRFQNGWMTVPVAGRP
jgi:hypothetical protein